MAKKKKDDDEKPTRLKPVPRSGAYVMMLFITLVAIIGGTVLLYLDYEQYGQKGESPPKESATVKTLGEINKEAGVGTAPAPAPGPGDGMPMGGMP